MIIALGIYQKGLPYLENPKLWTKVVLVLAWTINSAMICRFIRSASPVVRARMFGISLGSLAYGSFLGVAKPLANGVAPFWMLLAGYIVSLLLAIAFLNQTQRAQMAVAA
jgi:CHASE2 domain-containing sensor protein